MRQVFGNAVAIHDDVAIVGTSPGPAHRALAYVFRTDGTNWVEETKLIPSAGAAGRNFGVVDINQDLAVASVEGSKRSEDGGAVYVYRFDGGVWTEEARIAPTGTVPGDRFGERLAVNSNRILAGATGENNDNGAAYIFSNDGSTWRQDARLVDPNPGVLDRFGLSVSLDGDVAVVGSFTSDNGLVESGSVHVFRFDGSDWNHEAKLVSPDPKTYDHFGHHTAIDGEWILVGADFDFVGTSEHVGSVHAYRWNGSEWIYEQKILADDAHAEGWFGFDISLSGDRAVIAGSIEESVFYSFVFDGTHWIQEAKYGQCEDVQCEKYDYFGENVDVSGNLAIISSKEENGDAGAVYIYELGSIQTRNESELPADRNAGVALRQNFPNPASEVTTFMFKIAEPGRARMSVVDLLGRQRDVLLDGDVAAGEHAIRYDTRDLGNGTYLYRLTTDHTTAVRSFVVVH